MKLKEICLEQNVQMPIKVKESCLPKALCNLMGSHLHAL